MSFYKKVDNIIIDLKDINKMYFSLHDRNKILVRESKYINYSSGGGEVIDAVDMPSAGLSGENHNNQHRYWVRSLRSRFY
tara:strand:+ start:40 stop:279 length:240 start_codon:yes stop_codon:yes gene_type:complete